MSSSTHGSMPGSVRTSGSVVDFTSDFATAGSIGLSRAAATATTTANASATIIATAPTLRSGSLSNLWIRSLIRTAGSCYPPGGRVAPTGMSPAATVTNPLFSMALLPSRRAPRPTGQVVPRNLRSVAMRTASYTAWVFRSTSLQGKPPENAGDFSSSQHASGDFREDPRLVAANIG